MSFKRINNITGWAICIIASFVYLSTMEANGSFWDTGEFASSAYKLQVPHPPGAPLFILLGRLFMIPFSDPNNAIVGLNTMSALMSGFTILFLFWTITHFARKIIERNSINPLTSQQVFTIMAAGVIGALAYTFSDSFWYSAVESEVYASSSFFTAIVFWAALKWEQEVTE
jgi:predicted membrane protein